MAVLLPFAPLAIEGLTAFATALVSAGAVGVGVAGAVAVGAAVGEAVAKAEAVASTLAQVPRTTYRDEPTNFKLPPHSKKAIMAALLASMMAKYLEKRGSTRKPHPENRGPTGNGVGWPLVDGPLGYTSTLARINIRLKDKHEWCGHFKKGPPQNVLRAVEGEEPKQDLVHQGAPPQGSKAGLAYAANGTQWIVAWHAPLNSNPKIYVEYGDEVEAPSQIDWSIIERKLDASGNESNCEGAMAKITSDGRDAAIFAVFAT